jgi:NAD(P)-dependent dehydrogenase (short-subunit alcohol dehydrogenase family)
LQTALSDEGHAVFLAKADLADEEAVGRLLDVARQEAGPIDLLVNNASVFLPDRADHHDPEIWQTHFAVNLQAPCRLAADVYAQTDVDAQKSRAIINLLDQRVLHPNPLYFSYTLSKSALWTATKTMAQSFAISMMIPGACIALFMYTLAGQADWAVGVPIALGSVFLVPTGVKIALKMSERRLRLAFAALLFSVVPLLLFHRG